MFERGASRELPELSILRACLLYLSRGWYTPSLTQCSVYGFMCWCPRDL